MTTRFLSTYFPKFNWEMNEYLSEINQRISSESDDLL